MLKKIAYLLWIVIKAIGRFIKGALKIAGFLWLIVLVSSGCTSMSHMPKKSPCACQYSPLNQAA